VRPQTRSGLPGSETGRPAVANPPTVTPAVDWREQRFHVEAGAYQTRPLAEVTAEDLRRRGYAAHIIPGPRYRVWVGGVLDRPTAERLAANLLAAGFDAALTLQ
jgi:cell division protein FtsN